MTIRFPFVLVVFDMGHHLEDQDLVAGIQDTSDQPKLVPPNVEDHTASDQTGCSKFRFHVPPGTPVDGPAAHVAIPRFQRAFRIGGIRSFPEFPQPRFGNYPHPCSPLLLVSGIIVRKKRTSQERVRELRTLSDFSFETFHQATDEGFHFDLIRTQ